MLANAWSAFQLGRQKVVILIFNCAHFQFVNGCASSRLMSAPLALTLGLDLGLAEQATCNQIKLISHRNRIWIGLLVTASYLAFGVSAAGHKLLA